MEAALSRARVAEEAYEKLKMEAQQDGAQQNGERELKPLRSQSWFNNADNPGVSGWVGMCTRRIIDHVLS